MLIIVIYIYIYTRVIGTFSFQIISKMLRLHHVVYILISENVNLENK